MPLAFGIPYKELANVAAGKRLPTLAMPEGTVVGGRSEYAYLFEWDEYFAPRALMELQQAGLITKVATNTTQLEGLKSFGYGTILIPVKMQTKTPMNLYARETVSKKNALDINIVKSGGAAWHDLGSSVMFASPGLK